MKQENQKETPEEMEAEVVAASRSGISWAWLFPILALAATGWLFWSNWKSKGPEITIHFATAPGIEPGKTVLIYRGVQAGTVSQVHLDRTLGTVAVTVGLKAFASELATEGTDYWIEEPVISLHEISGLESIIQGNSIQARTHGGTQPASIFTGMDEAPLMPLDAKDLTIRLSSSSIPFLNHGTPVFHRGINVGAVRTKQFNAAGQPEVEVIIFEKFTDKVRSNSRFWVSAATAVSASPGVVRLDIPSLQGLVDGSVAFDHFGTPGDAVNNDTEFDLSNNITAARADGPRITITFDQGAGLRPGETRVTCLGQPVGLVEQVTTDPASKKVDVVARLESSYAALASEDSVFAITRPSISPRGIQGLDTIVTGPCVAFEPGQSKIPATRFVGREVPQLDWDLAPEDKDGARVVLWGKSLPQLMAGTPIYHHGMVAGRVLEPRLGSEGRSEMVITIDAKFRDFLRINSRFWRVPVASLAVGPGLLGVELQGMPALLQGGIAFDAFGSAGPSAPASAEYEVYPNEQTASAVSDPIRIVFDDGQGLIAGKTELRYLGVPVGVVETVRVMEGRVEATARFQPGYDFLRKRGSEFAIIRPEIDLKGVHGLETVIGGVHISCSPGEDSSYAETFDAVPPEVPALMNEPGLEVVLESPGTKIDAGAPVSYNETPVGEVISKTLSRNGKSILLKLRIRDEHRNLVRTNSVFWDSTRVDAKIGFLKVEIDTPSVIEPNGRVEFRTPDEGGMQAKKDTVFSLLPLPPAFLVDSPAATPAPTPKPFKGPQTWKR